MIKEIRDKFNQEFSTEKYNAFVKHLDEIYNKEVVFRVSETPMFVNKQLKERLIAASEKIIDVICQPNFNEITERAIPKHLVVKNQNKQPHFICIDFAICEDENKELTPQMIELQGFASLYCWQDLIGNQYKEHFYCPPNYSHHFNGFNSETYLEFLKKVIVGNYNPDQVILLELLPHQQKTRIDFYATEDKLEIPIVCLSEVIQKGKKIYYIKNNIEIEIKRIYNRLIFDDLEAHPNFKYSVDLFGDLDVEWVAHPNWFYRISKYTMPFLKNAFVPETFFLSELKTIPFDLENYVLKPLFSFSGMGVIIDVKIGDITSINDKENWILQRKVEYVDAIQSPEGGVKCEIRMMYLWPDGDEHPTLSINLARMSRGKMIGVRYNKDFNWVGGTVALFEM
jgi:hypothetical protein